MADNDQKDSQKVTTPKAKTEYSNPNDLKESLDDLAAYERLTKSQLPFNSTDGDRMTKETHKPASELPDTFKKTTDDKELPLYNLRENEGHELNDKVRKEVEQAHKDAPAAAVTNIVEASNRNLNLEDKIKDSNKSNEGVKYHGDKLKRRTPKPDKYKDINRETIRTKDVIAALADLHAFEVLAALPDRNFKDDDFKELQKRFEPALVPVRRKEQTQQPLKQLPWPPQDEPVRTARAFDDTYKGPPKSMGTCHKCGTDGEVTGFSLGYGSRQPMCRPCTHADEGFQRVLQQNRDNDDSRYDYKDTSGHAFGKY